MTEQEKKDKILGVIKNIPLEKWSEGNYYSTEINGLKIRTYCRGDGNPPGVEVDGLKIWGAKVEQTSDIFYSVDTYFKEKKVVNATQKIELLYTNLCV